MADPLTARRRNLFVILFTAALQAGAFGIYKTKLPLYLQFLGTPLMSLGLIFGISQVGILAVGHPSYGIGTSCHAGLPVEPIPWLPFQWRHFSHGRHGKPGGKGGRAGLTREADCINILGQA